MKKILFAFSVLLAIAACTNKPVTAVDNNEESTEVVFEVAKNYFFKNDQVIPEYPKITTEEEFTKLFGMATKMGEDGKPTAIDFTKQFVLAIVLPETDFATEINPVKVEDFFYKKGSGPYKPDPFGSKLIYQTNYASSAKYLIVLTIWLVYEFSLSYHETT